MHWPSWAMGFWSGTGACATAYAVWVGAKEFRRQLATRRLLERCDEYAARRRALRGVGGAGQ